MQILVIGPHRSGTSLVARLLNMMGAYFGPEGISWPANDANIKGFWERLDVLEVNDAILAASQCRWDRLSGWNIAAPPAIPEKTRQRLRSTLFSMDGFRPWMLKDPRLCLTLPLWREYLEVPLAIVVHRHPIETALSLQRRQATPYPLPYGLAIWEYYAAAALNHTAQMPRCLVSYHHLLANPVEETQKLHNWVIAQGTRRLSMPSEREITAFIDPSLRRAKREDATAALSLTPEQETLARCLAGQEQPSGLCHVSAQGIEAMRYYGA